MINRNPQLMSPEDTCLVVVDVQEKLIPLIGENKRIVWNIRRLIDAAKLLSLPVFGSEQYPKGLGATVSPLKELIDGFAEKTAFSCGGCDELMQNVAASAGDKVLVAGIESHVCIQQTVFDLMAEGYSVYIAVDAVGARGQIDHEIALRRMESAGATLTTTESAIFEWCVDAKNPQFKAISALIQEPTP
ncbi:MAG: hydrolase [bacterium]|nr:hydrolase [bacterium]